MKSINFIFPFLTTSYSLRLWVFCSLCSIGATLIGITLLTYSQLSLFLSLKAEYSTLERDNTYQENENTSKQKLLLHYKNTKKLYKHLTTKENLPHRFLGALAQAIDSDTWVNEITYIRNQKVILKGHTYNSSSIAPFITALSQQIPHAKIAIRNLSHINKEHSLSYELEVLFDT